MTPGQLKALQLLADKGTATIVVWSATGDSVLNGPCVHSTVAGALRSAGWAIGVGLDRLQITDAGRAALAAAG